MNAIPIEENMHRSNGSLALELNQKICIPSLSQLLKKKKTVGLMKQDTSGQYPS